MHIGFYILISLIITFAVCLSLALLSKEDSILETICISGIVISVLLFLVTSVVVTVGVMDSESYAITPQEIVRTSNSVIVEYKDNYGNIDHVVSEYTKHFMADDDDLIIKMDKGYNIWGWFLYTRYDIGFKSPVVKNK